METTKIVYFSGLFGESMYIKDPVLASRKWGSKRVGVGAAAAGAGGEEKTQTPTVVYVCIYFYSMPRKFALPGWRHAYSLK